MIYKYSCWLLIGRDFRNLWMTCSHSSSDNHQQLTALYSCWWSTVMQLIPAYIPRTHSRTVWMAELFHPMVGLVFFFSPRIPNRLWTAPRIDFHYIYIYIETCYIIPVQACVLVVRKTYTSNSCEVESELFWLRHETCSMCGLVNVTSWSENRTCHSSSELLSNKQTVLKFLLWGTNYSFKAIK